MKQLLQFLLVLPATAVLALDNDNDGMDDLWQQRYSIAPFTGSLDPDGDGRINLVESRNYSNPGKVDSHPMGIVIIRDLNPVDGLHDPWQQQFGITAAQKWDDHDEDGRTNFEESVSKSHPFVADAPYSLAGALTPAVERPGPDSFIARMPDSAQGRRYMLEVSDTLLPGSWTTATMANNAAPYQWGTGEEISGEALTGNSPRKFFRWKIDDPDSDGDMVNDWNETLLGSNPQAADTDGDGFLDGEEYQQSANPLSDADLPGVGEAWAERDGTQKDVWFLSGSKGVSNSWNKTEPPNQPTTTGAYITWADYDTPSQTDPYGLYEARWSAKFGELSFPPALTPGSVNYTSGRVEARAGQRLAYAGSANETKNFVELGHVYFTMGSSQATATQPWNVVRRLLAFDRVVTYPSYAHQYSTPRFEKFTIAQGSARAVREEKLEPTLADGQSNESVWMELSVSMKGGEELAYDSLTHTANGDPRPWIMLPEGEDREIHLNFSNGTGSLGYQAHGPVTPQTVVHQNSQTPVYASPKFRGTSGTGPAYLKVGVMKLPSDTPQFVEETFVNFAVYDKKRLSVIIHPIALAGTSYTPTNIPSEADAESYLNSVFKVQANIEVDVTVRGVISVAYDLGLGIPITPPVPGDPSPPPLDTRGACNETFDILWGYGVRSKIYSAEELAIRAASNPVAGSINVYLIASGTTPQKSNLIYHSWPSPLQEQAGMTAALIKTSCNGFAGSSDNDNFNILWVKSRPVTYPLKTLFTIAHEIGHEMGLLHSAEAFIDTSTSTYEGTLRFTDNEARLMSGRSGPKQILNPKRLIKWEWDKIREYEDFSP
jgi:hypothetical protein